MTDSEVPTRINQTTNFLFEEKFNVSKGKRSNFHAFYVQNNL